MPYSSVLKRGFFDFCIFLHFIAIFRFWRFCLKMFLNLNSNILTIKHFFQNRSLEDGVIVSKKRLQKKLSDLIKNCKKNLGRRKQNNL